MAFRIPKRWLVALAVVVGCSSNAPPVPTPAQPKPASAIAAAVSPAPSRARAPALTAASPPPTLLITDPELLRELEKSGLGLSSLLSGAQSAESNATLSQQPRFAGVVKELEDELQRAAAADKLAGVDVARFSHRLFDRRFLRLPQARFELAGVVNRPDRAPFAPRSCGEVRLVYRLRYQLDAERASKLPMTLGVERQVPEGSDGCRSAQARWVEPTNMNVHERAAWLRSEQGPLSGNPLPSGDTNVRIVVNLQQVRWPSTVRPDLGGHAEYLLRSFRPDSAGIFRAEALENTIDPQAFATPARQQELARALEAQVTNIDQGTPLLPESLLAKRALSVTPRGLSRLTNRPFSAALSPQLLASSNFSNGYFVKSPAGMLRRLDQLSCQGCHEARSVAGFHLLGEDGADAASENALALPVSPQVVADLPRRLQIARAMLAGQTPDFAAPFAERPSAAGNYGDACSISNDPTFASWKCAPGLSCSSSEAGPRSLVGHCLPSAHAVGDACERGSVTEARDRLRDHVSGVSTEVCPDMVCNRSGVGFPGGMCTASCGAPGSRCGAIAILDPFNACLGRGESFLACIRANVSPAGLRACDAENPCRDDYVCARTPQGGACLPPYFVFQLRVDGHSSSLR